MSSKEGFEPHNTLFAKEPVLEPRGPRRHHLRRKSESDGEDGGGSHGKKMKKLQELHGTKINSDKNDEHVERNKEAKVDVDFRSEKDIGHSKSGTSGSDSKLVTEKAGLDSKSEMQNEKLKNQDLPNENDIGNEPGKNQDLARSSGDGGDTGCDCEHYCDVDTNKEKPGQDSRSKDDNKTQVKSTENLEANTNAERKTSKPENVHEIVDEQLQQNAGPKPSSCHCRNDRRGHPKTSQETGDSVISKTDKNQGGIVVVFQGACGDTGELSSKSDKICLCDERACGDKCGANNKNVDSMQRGPQPTSNQQVLHQEKCPIHCSKPAAGGDSNLHQCVCEESKDAGGSGDGLEEHDKSDCRDVKDCSDVIEPTDEEVTHNDDHDVTDTESTAEKCSNGAAAAVSRSDVRNPSIADDANSVTSSKGVTSKRLWSARTGRWKTADNYVIVITNKGFMLHCFAVLMTSLHMAGVYMHLVEYTLTLGSTPTRAAALFVSVGILR
jgi:hypothetical protein